MLRLWNGMKEATFSFALIYAERKKVDLFRSMQHTLTAASQTTMSNIFMMANALCSQSFWWACGLQLVTVNCWISAFYIRLIIVECRKTLQLSESLLFKMHSRTINMVLLVNPFQGSVVSLLGPRLSWASQQMSWKGKSCRLDPEIIFKLSIGRHLNVQSPLTIGQCDLGKERENSTKILYPTKCSY